MCKANEPQANSLQNLPSKTRIKRINLTHFIKILEKVEFNNQFRIKSSVVILLPWEKNKVHYLCATELPYVLHISLIASNIPL